MAIAYRNGSAAGTTTPGTTATVAKPASMAAGDLLLIYVNVNNTEVISDGQSGTYPFTSVYGTRVYNGGSACYRIWRRWVTASEPDNYTFTWVNVERWGIVAVAYSGVDSVTPINVVPADGTENTATDANAIVQSIATLTDNSVVVASTHADGGTVNVSSGPSGFTLRQNTAGQCVGVADKPIPAKTTQAATQFTLTESGATWTTQILALNTQTCDIQTIWVD